MKKIIICEDAETIRPVVKAWIRECNAADFDIVIEVDEFMKDFHAMVRNEWCRLFVLVNEGDPVGFIGVVIQILPFNLQRMANEHYWYILPEHRGIGSLRLIAAATDWAKQMGCHSIMATASNMASDLHDKTCELYEIIGMKRFETTYIHRIGV